MVLMIFQSNLGGLFNLWIMVYLFLKLSIKARLYFILEVESLTCVYA